jgi:hypothetical protein
VFDTPQLEITCWQIVDSAHGIAATALAAALPALADEWQRVPEVSAACECCERPADWLRSLAAPADEPKAQS